MPRFLRTACRNAHADHVPEYRRARHARSRRGWAPASRIVTVGHGVRDEFFRREPARSPAAVAAVRRAVAADERDRRAAERLHAACPPARRAEARLRRNADAGGGGVVVVPLRRAAAGHGPAAGRYSRLTELYRDADAFLFPSSYEGFGLALVEAMAARLPIVTTRVGVAADALRDRRSALFVPLRGGDALAAAVEELIGNPTMRAQLGEQRAHRCAVLP